MRDENCDDLRRAVNSLEGLRFEVCVLDYQEFNKCKKSSNNNLKKCEIEQESMPDLLAWRKRGWGSYCLIIELKTGISGRARQLEKTWSNIKQKINNARSSLVTLGCNNFCGNIVVVPPEYMRFGESSCRMRRDEIYVVTDLDNLPLEAEKLISAKRGVNY